MKKIVSLILLCLIIISMAGTVKAVTLSCKVSMQIEKTEFKKGDEFTVDIDISNIQSEAGVISLGATLEYDKDSLTLVKMEGQNGWETPSVGASYNENNGKMAITRSGPSKNDETIFKITFKVKEEAKKNLLIALKNITVADGTTPFSVNQVYKNITVKEGTNNEVPNPIPDGNTLPIISNTNTNNTDTTPDEKLPQTGVTNTVIGVGIATAIAVAFGCFIRLHNLSK